MGSVNDRGSRPTKRFDKDELARLTEDRASSIPAASDEDEDDIFKEWGIEPVDLPSAPQVARAAPAANSRVGIGTTPPHGVHATELVPEEVRTKEVSGAVGARSRSATVHDPLTTSVLAEVARRTHAGEGEPVNRDTTSPGRNDTPTPTPSRAKTRH